MSSTQTILITGATSGIGREAATYFANRGHRVIATGRNEDVLAALRDDGIHTVRMDVTDAGSIAAACDAVRELTGGYGVDVLINNAGYGMLAALVEITDSDLRAQFETNVFGLMAVTRAFLPEMLQRGSGRILNVSSIGGRVTFPFFGAYSATKYAVESLSDALRLELAPFGIKVVVIEPGPIRTGFGDRSLSELARYRRDDSRYAPVYARTEELHARFDRQSVGPECVVRAMDRAITRRRPRARYIAPRRAAVMLRMLLALPTSWTDTVARGLLGLRKGKLQHVPTPGTTTRPQSTRAAA